MTDLLVELLREAREVFAQSAHEDHRNETDQEDHHHERVEDREPVDLHRKASMRHSGQADEIKIDKYKLKVK